MRMKLRHSKEDKKEGAGGGGEKEDEKRRRGKRTRRMRVRRVRIIFGIGIHPLTHSKGLLFQFWILLKMLEILKSLKEPKKTIVFSANVF